jgi:Lipopolysaccharide-assembly
VFRLKTLEFRLAASWRALAAATCVALCGCAYHLGPTNGLPAGSRSVQVNIFQNRVLEEPRLSEYVTHALRKQLQQDGTFTLDTHKTGDVIVNGTIVRYRRAGLSYQPQDIITPRDYLVTMTAVVTAREQSTGKLLLNNRRVQGHTTVRIGSDLTTAERQSIPLLADDLARNITALLADGEW